MAVREFKADSERKGGQFRPVSRVHCRKCGVSTSIQIKSGSGLLPPAFIAKKFSQLGWEIGSNEQWDFCPGCVNARKEKPPLQLVKNEEVTLVNAAPREMTRDERRLIFAKLDEVYLDEKRGYDAGWSDHKVATDLGVPRKWVEIIRDENFGSIGLNEDMSAYLTEAEALCKEARKALEEARKAREAVEAILKNPAFLQFGEISTRLGKVEKLASEVRKLVVVS